MAPWGSSRFSSGVRRARSRHSLQRRQAFPQPPLLLPALGDIPQDGGDPQRLAGGVPQHDDAELDGDTSPVRSEEHTSELQSRPHLVCRLLLEKKKKKKIKI